MQISGLGSKGDLAVTSGVSSPPQTGYLCHASQQRVQKATFEASKGIVARNASINRDDMIFL
jgi:hypothetical protein